MRDIVIKDRIRRLENFIAGLVDYLQIYLEEGDYHMAQAKATELANQIGELEYLKGRKTFLDKVEDYSEKYAERMKGGE
tara:strand:+ start:256 stop:492 length:237 start_codon:yes stop_codon:yes gene_type:complete